MNKKTPSKKYKVVFIIVSIVILPIKFPIFLLSKIGKVAEMVLDWLDNAIWELLLSKFYY